MNVVRCALLRKPIATLWPIVATLILSAVAKDVHAQAPHWARRAGGGTVDEATSISMDAEGNSYTTGYFTGTATFGTQVLSSSGVTDVFITKNGPDGNFLWAVKAGGTGPDRALAITTDSDGNTYMTGFFHGQATFGGQTLQSTGQQDVFIAKYASDGTLVWAVRAGGGQADIGNGIAVDQAGNVLVTGEFAGTAAFGAFSLTSMNGSVDVFTVKLNAQGDFIWAKQGAAPQTDRGIDVACDATGNVYVTGQFSDTITFDVTHLNNIVNAIFIIKYNAQGQEQWFRKAGGGLLNVATGIAADNSGNVLLTGDFTGNTIFYGTPSTTLSATYANRIFVAKFNGSGALQWAIAESSDSEVTSRDIAVDGAGNAYITGHFKCRFNSLSDRYGQGTFNSVGHRDIFMAKFSPAGQWAAGQSVGGRQDDNGMGIAVSAHGQAHTAGSFSAQINIPTPDDFLAHGAEEITSQPPYCNSGDYGQYHRLNSAGNLDILILNIFDAQRPPYDYYWRSGSGCSRPYHGVCIRQCSNSNHCIPVPPVCQDSLQVCASSTIVGVSNTTEVGPAFTYQWANGPSTINATVNDNGYYSVTQTSEDGCFVSTDSIHVTILPLPPFPLISDSYGINNEALNTTEIIICDQDSVLLTGSGYGQNSHGWNGPTGLYYIDEVWATESGFYGFFVTDSNGCSRSNSISVIIPEPFPPVILGLISLNDPDSDGHISLCAGESFEMFTFDSISNSNGNLDCIDYSTHNWSATPSGLTFDGTTVCLNNSINEFTPTASGLYTITDHVVRVNECYVDTISISYDLYVELLPVPQLDSMQIAIYGNPYICPGDSLTLMASPAPNYEWAGPDSSITGFGNSITVYEPGPYSVSTSLSETNEYGCTTTVSAQAVHMVNMSPQPNVTMNPGSGLICPGGSVLLTCNGSGQFLWHGPDGTFGDNAPSVEVNSPGIYYCVRTDVYGCALVSNTVLVNQYTTPFLTASPSATACAGDSVTITLSSDPGSSVEWLPPLSGSEWQHTVWSSGVYSVNVTSCDIATEASIQIVVASPEPEILVVGSPTFCEGDSVTLVAVPGPFSFTWLPNISDSTAITLFESGEFSLVVSDGGGCSATAGPVSINMVSNTQIPPLINDTAVCPGGHAVLHVLGTGLFRWYAQEMGGTPISTGMQFTTPGLTAPATYFVSKHNAYCESDRSPVQVLIEDCEGIDLPNVFTPNGDGINDLFHFGLKGTRCFRCDIYSRWGRLLHAWEDAASGWDGTLMRTGQLVSEGTYYWVLNYCDYLGNSKHGAGYVTVTGLGE